MKEFFNEYYIDIFRHGVETSVIGIIMWVISLVLFLGVIYWSGHLIDSLWLPVNNGTGVVVSKEFCPSYTISTVIYDSSNKTTIPQTSYHSDEWIVGIMVNDIVCRKVVTEKFYNKLYMNNDVDIKYSFGRIWKTLYIKKIYVEETE